MQVAPLDFHKDEGALRKFLCDDDAEGLTRSSQALIDGDAVAKVARIGGETVAWALVILRYREDYGLPANNVVVAHVKSDDAYLVSIEVQEDLRGKGVGGALLDAIEEATAAQGKRRLWLHVAEGNVEAHRFYERHDWVHTSTVKSPGNTSRVYAKDLHD